MTETPIAILMRFAKRLAAGLAASLALVGAAMADSVPLEVETAKASSDPATGLPVMMVELTPSGSKAFGDFTARNVGMRVDVILEGKVLTSPYFQTPITGGSLMISGNFTPEEVETMAERIQAVAGALQVRIPAP